MKINFLGENAKQVFKENGRKLLLAEIRKFEIDVFKRENEIIRISFSIKDNSSIVEIQAVRIICPPGPIDAWDSILFNLNMTIDEFKVLLEEMSS